MKHIKEITGLFLLLIAVCITQACSDSYDEVDSLINDSGNYNANMAVIVNPSTLSGATLIDTDQNGYAYIANPKLLSDSKINQKGQRIFYTYSTTSQTASDGIPFITVIKVNKVLTKAPEFLEDGNTEEFGTDPIDIDGGSISKAHLNLSYTLLSGNHTIVHRISLLIDKDAKPDARGYLDVELRHSAEGDLPINANSGYVSFTLEDMPGFKEGSLKGFRIKTKTTKGGTTTVEVKKEQPKN